MDSGISVGNSDDPGDLISSNMWISDNDETIIEPVRSGRYVRVLPNGKETDYYIEVDFENLTYNALMERTWDEAMNRGTISVEDDRIIMTQDTRDFSHPKSYVFYYLGDGMITYAEEESQDSLMITCCTIVDGALFRYTEEEQ